MTGESLGSTATAWKEALRGLIKVALRHFGMRVVAIKECERSTDVTAALN